MKVRCEPGCGWSLRDKFCESPKGSTVVIAPCGLHPCWGRDRGGNIAPKSSKHHLCARWQTRQMVWTRGARRHFATVVEANRQPSAKRLGGPNVGSEGALPTGENGAASRRTAYGCRLIERRTFEESVADFRKRATLVVAFRYTKGPTRFCGEPRRPSIRTMTTLKASIVLLHNCAGFHRHRVHAMDMHAPYSRDRGIPRGLPSTIVFRGCNQFERDAIRRFAVH